MQRLSTFLKYFLQCLIIVSILSCNEKDESPFIEVCDANNLLGKYLFFSATDTSSQHIEINALIDGRFQTKGIGGFGFWFPSAPLSGVINDCNITIDPYEDVEREGLPSPGGTKRYYYESMSGYGEFYAGNDSIKLFITYERTGDFTAYFSDDIFLVKVD